jgi:hypothetical protein
MGVKVTVDKTADILRAVKELTSREVLIGIPDVNAARKADSDDPSPISKAAIGYIMENGSPIKNIPARPFLVPGVQSIKDKAIARLKIAAKAALEGDTKQIDKQLDAIGLMAQGAVQKKMKAGPFAPLAPATIAARKRKGRTGTEPLLDTGALWQAIAYVIRNKRK